jgi:GT2 family glycosyltransferase
VDNASTDDTVVQLGARGLLKHELIEFHRLPQNTGGAGGFHEGMRLAMGCGADWIWVMDDDAEPCADALEKLEPALDSAGVAGVASLTLALDGRPQLEHRGWLNVCGLTPRAHRAVCVTGADRDAMEISFASFVGLAVPRRVVEKIGLPKRELFIKGDDLEYCIRMSREGPIILVPESRIFHKDGFSAAYEIRRRLGFRSNRVPLDKLWMNYFSVRNLIWIRRQYCGSLIAGIFSARQFTRYALGILLFDTDRRIRLRFFREAIRDAWADEFDNQKPKELTRLPENAARRDQPAI